jgi:hypothetical protein
MIPYWKRESHFADGRSVFLIQLILKRSQLFQEFLPPTLPHDLPLLSTAQGHKFSCVSLIPTETLASKLRLLGTLELSKTNRFMYAYYSQNPNERARQGRRSGSGTGSRWFCR